MKLEKKYKEFDKLLLNDGDENKINELFTQILDDAIEILNEKNRKNEFLEYPDDKFVIRALFEYFLELWSDGELEEAKKLGYDLVYMVNDENLKEAFSMFILGILEKLSVDEFLDNYVIPENNDDKYDLFFTNFDDKIDELVIKHRDTFKKEFSE